MREEITKKYFIEFESKNFYENIKNYFYKFEKNDVFKHTLEVVDEIKNIADALSIDKEKCMVAAYLHDIGRVIKKEELILFCSIFGQRIEEEEKLFPSILHQKASRIIAKNLFKIDDDHILNAIECHTTLKANPSEIEKAVFLADKLSWQEDEHQDLVSKMRTALEDSKEKAIFYYQEDLYNKRESLLCYHNWSRQAYQHFKNITSGNIA